MAYPCCLRSAAVTGSAGAAGLSACVHRLIEQARRFLTFVDPHRARGYIPPTPSANERQVMELVLAVTLGLMVGSGVYLILRARSFSVVLGLALLSHATNLLLFAAGGLQTDRAPLLAESPPFTDPLPQALVLTAIVIGFAMTAFVLVLALRVLADTGSERVDARRGEEER